MGAPERRFPKVVESIRQIAVDSGAGEKLPTLNELAARLSVSRATVVRALEHLESQGVLTRRHGSGIFAAPDLGRPQILVILNSTMLADISPVWGLLLRHLLEAGKSCPEHLVFEFTKPEADPLVPLESLSADTWRAIQGKRYSAVIVIGANSEVSWEIERLGVRTISFAAAGRYVVQMSQADVCQKGCRALAELGCERVAVLGASDASVLEFADAVLRENGSRLVSARPGGGGKPTISLPENRFLLAHRAYQDAIAIFEGASKESVPDGVVMLDDMYTQGFLHGLIHTGRTVGRDVLVATHTNSGSPALVGFDSQVIRLEYDLSAITDTLLYAMRCVLKGIAPTEHGWDSAVVVEGRTTEIEILTVRAQLFLPEQVY